jgi:asparagine synthase (glutamine-hydrolysing)
MPGIAAVIGNDSVGDYQLVVEDMLSSMKHDDVYRSATHSAPNMGVYAGSVAFRAGENQILFNEQKDIALIFSGECFFDSRVGNELRRKGHQIGEAPASWLVHLYEEEGEQFVERLNGLFSGLLIDERQRKVHLFNDRYGSEKLYCHQAKDAVYFASEAKGLLRVLPETRAFDEQGVGEFLTYGCTLEGRTLFRGIQRLPGASLWSFDCGQRRKRRYFSPTVWEAQPPLLGKTFEARFQETFTKILPRYFKAHTRIGISLTGGLDTRMIMACQPHADEKPVCYTFSGEKGLTLDDRLAARIAQACGLEHTLLRIRSDFFSDFSDYADRTVYLTDGCFGVTGAHEIYLNRQARELALVRLTGNYGNEVLRGASTFKPIHLSSSLFNPEFSRSFDAAAAPMVEGRKHPITFAAFHEIPWNLFGSLAAARSQVIVRTPYLDNELVGLAYRAPKDLRQSTAAASHLIKTINPSLSRIPTDRGQSRAGPWPSAALKRFFSEATFKLDYLNNEGCPHWLSPFDLVFARITSTLKVLGLHKYLHYRSWFRRELAGYLKSAIANAEAQQAPFWNTRFLKNLANDHISGRRNYVIEINAVLTLEAIQRLLFRELPCAARESGSFTIPTARSVVAN